MTSKISAAAVLVATALASVAAQASVVRTLNMTFQSGATFNGQVTFLDDYSAVTNVTGTLNGYQYGAGFQGSGSDSINWIWANGTDYSSSPTQYSTFLMDGPGSGYTSLGGYTTWIQLAYDFSAAPVLSFTSGVSYGGFDNYVNYVDAMVSGSIGNTVPEPSTFALAGLALLGFGAAARRKAR